MSSENSNFARTIGWSSEAAAIVFTILYVPLFGYFLYRFFRRPTYVHYFLALFCAIRITAFAIRSRLLSSGSAGQNRNLFLADAFLFGVGYFALLYSAFSLVIDREELSRHQESRKPNRAHTGGRMLFRLLLTVAVILGIAAVAAHHGSQTGTNSTLRKITIVIFLVLTVWQVIQTLVLMRMERHAFGTEKRVSTGMRHAATILLLISLLLLLRELFVTATLNNLSKQNNEHLWYPLVAVPEIIAVALFATPRLVPKKLDLQDTQRYPRDQHAPVPNRTEIQGQQGYPQQV